MPVSVKAHCSECEYVFSQSGDPDDGSFVETVSRVGQHHADSARHKVEFLRHEHTPKILEPRTNVPYGEELPHVANPLHDSYV